MDTRVNGKSIKNDIPSVYIAGAAILAIFLLIIPVPVPVLDALMVLNLMFSIMILLVILFQDDPTEFTVFPSMLLMATVFGLGINVSSTRLILQTGKAFDG